MSEPDCSQQAYAEAQYDHDYRKLEADNERLRGLLRQCLTDEFGIGRGIGSKVLRQDIDAALAGAAVQPSAAHAFCGPFPEQSEDERTLRFLLALRCGEPGELYGDDGELQLGGFPHPIDFRRDSVQEIRRKLDARGMAKLIEQQRRAADPTPAPQPQCACEYYWPGQGHHPDCPTRNAAQQPTAPTSGGHDGD